MSWERMLHDNIDASGGRLSRLMQYRELRAEMGRRGREFVEDEFDMARHNRRLVEIYEAIISRQLGRDRREADGQ